MIQKLCIDSLRDLSLAGNSNVIKMVVEITELADPPSYGTPAPLNLERTIFLSHSGADKHFVRDLHADLLACSYDSFFDEKTLPKAKIVKMRNILPEARVCRLAVFILSEEFFTKTKNPMLELATCVEAKVQLLPLFYRITVPDLKDESKRKKWLEKWIQWEQEQETRPGNADPALKVDVSKWEACLTILGDTNGVEYGKVATNPNKYRDVIVETICGIVPPDVQWDDSHVQGKERLWKVVDNMFARASCPLDGVLGGARVVALHGVGGIGKTTLCSSLLNFYFPEFRGRVYHLKLDSEEGALERVKNALIKLTKASPHLIERVKDPGEGWHLLKKHIHERKVFLAIDNVGTEKSIEEAESYLRSGPFKDGTKILIMARSPAILSRLLRRNGDCIPASMPDLLHDEAKKIFLQKTMYLGNEDPKQKTSQEDDSIVSQCVDLCSVSKGGDQGQHYHPLMLISLGALLASESSDPCGWRGTLKELSSHPSIGMDRVFELLQRSYDALERVEKQIFLDVTLYVPRKLLTYREILGWLYRVHDEMEFQMKKLMLKLRDMAFWTESRGIVCVHDLYRELAIKEAKYEDDANKSSLFFKDREVSQSMLSEMLGKSAGRLKRLGFVNCKVEGGVLDLSECCGIKVLRLVGNEGLTSVILGHKTTNLLRSLEVEVEPPRILTLQGLNQCPYVQYLRLENCEVTEEDRIMPWQPSSSKVHINLPECLKFVEVTGVVGTINLQHLRGCVNLETLRVKSCDAQGNLELSNSRNLREVELYDCGVSQISGLSALGKVERFELVRCNKVSKLSGLAGWRFLQYCGIQNCQGLEEIDDLGVIPISFVGLGLSCSIDLGEIVIRVDGCKNLQEINSRQVIGGPLRPWCSRNPRRAKKPWDAEKALGLVWGVLPTTFPDGLKTLCVYGEERPHKSYMQRLLQNLQHVTTLQILKVQCHSCDGLCLDDHGDCGCGENPPDFSGLPNLTELSYHCAHLWDLSSLSGCASLRYLRLDGCSSVVSDSWPDFARLTSLRYLGLDGTSLEPAWPEKLPNMTIDFFLSISGCKVPGEDLVDVILASDLARPIRDAALVAIGVCDEERESTSICSRLLASKDAVTRAILSQEARPFPHWMSFFYRLGQRGDILLEKVLRIERMIPMLIDSMFLEHDFARDSVFHLGLDLFHGGLILLAYAGEPLEDTIPGIVRVIWAFFYSFPEIYSFRDLPLGFTDVDWLNVGNAICTLARNPQVALHLCDEDVSRKTYEWLEEKKVSGWQTRRKTYEWLEEKKVSGWQTSMKTYEWLEDKIHFLEKDFPHIKPSEKPLSISQALYQALYIGEEEEEDDDDDEEEDDDDEEEEDDDDDEEEDDDKEEEENES